MLGYGKPPAAGGSSCEKNALRPIAEGFESSFFPNLAMQALSRYSWYLFGGLVGNEANHSTVAAYSFKR